MPFHGRSFHFNTSCDHADGSVLSTLIPSAYHHHQKIKWIIANFIWSGMKNKNKYHLTKLDHISMPKRLGGWGILNLRRFDYALLLKSLWKGIFGEGTWGMIIKHKYLKDIDFLVFLRRRCIGCKIGSSIWLSFTKVRHYFLSLVT